MSVAQNLMRVRERIGAACRRSGRNPGQVRLVAVSKGFPPDAIREAWKANQRDFGENRVQEAEHKRAALSDLAITWHLVGHLQTNKAKLARSTFHWIHSIDSVRVAEKLAQAPHGPTERTPILLQVNLGDEPGKFGAGQEATTELAREIGRLASLELRGLMVIPPFLERAEEVRPFFRRLRKLARAIEAQNLPGVKMTDLSMGMSHDFEIAIEEGATFIRVGTAIFGERPQAQRNPI